VRLWSNLCGICFEVEASVSAWHSIRLKWVDKTCCVCFCAVYVLLVLRVCPYQDGMKFVISFHGLIR